jgi:hypothetical protein
MEGNGWKMLRESRYHGRLLVACAVYTPAYNWGWWWARVAVDGVQKDLKNQLYPQHGSLPPSQAPPLSLVSIHVQHLYWRWITDVVWNPITESWVLGWRFGIHGATGQALCRVQAA